MGDFVVFVVIAAVVFAVAISSASHARREAGTRLMQLHRELLSAELDPLRLQTVVSQIVEFKFMRFPQIGGEIYGSALDLLSNNPKSPIAKQLVLDIGRWHYGKSRPDGRPTVYDEQAIQNDILVRSIG
ncbi:MAG TPA: hypothetical protein VFI31_25415 [Pirellulales bacterium]|nr:hypothetical protein [Pirellulales bacterium]